MTVTIWRPAENPDHLVHYELKKVLRGRKTFNELIEQEINGNDELSAADKVVFIQAHKDRPVGQIQMDPVTLAAVLTRIQRLKKFLGL